MAIDNVTIPSFASNSKQAISSARKKSNDGLDERYVVFVDEEHPTSLEMISILCCIYTLYIPGGVNIFDHPVVVPKSWWCYHGPISHLS